MFVIPVFDALFKVGGRLTKLKETNFQGCFTQRKGLKNSSNSLTDGQGFCIDKNK